jgi:hypothetical protein
MKVYTRDLMDPFKITSAASSGSAASSASSASSAKHSDSANRACTAVSGGINIIDLANINSCCFIETEDRGTVTTCNTHGISRKASTYTKAHSTETNYTKTNCIETNCTKTNCTKTNCTFTIDGRIKNSELRGCNMLIEE